MSTCVLTPEPGSPSSPENHLSMVSPGPETLTQKVNIHRVTMCLLSVLFSVLQEENLHVLFTTSLYFVLIAHTSTSHLPIKIIYSII